MKTKAFLITNIFATVVVAAMVVGIIHIKAQSWFEPQCPFPDPEDRNVFYPHPTDCNKFLHCQNGIAFLKCCPADLHWNVELEKCDYPTDAGCVPLDMPDPYPGDCDTPVGHPANGPHKCYNTVSTDGHGPFRDEYYCNGIKGCLRANGRTFITESTCMIIPK